MKSYRVLLIAIFLPLGSSADNASRTPVSSSQGSHQTKIEAEEAEKEYRRGVQFAEGDGVPQDYARAARFYRLAAEKGLAAAQYALGYLYATGKGVPRDFKQAAIWYRKAALQDDPEAQNNLGALYST